MIVRGKLVLGHVGEQGVRNRNPRRDDLVVMCGGKDQTLNRGMVRRQLGEFLPNMPGFFDTVIFGNRLGGTGEQFQ